jgi:rhodanese-related sulfurtransferase
MYMKKVFAILLTAFIAVIFNAAGAVSSEGYNYITAKDLNDRLGAGSPMIIIDICPVEQFAKGHIKGSIETNAFPVKTDAEKARLTELIPTIKASGDDVVIVCPRGGGGAKNTFDLYKAQGIDVNRMLILEQGMDKWPYETEKK